MVTSQFDYTLSEILPVLRGFSRRFTRDPDESGDLVQDTVLKALAYRHKYREDVNLKGWLYIIMRNIFINHYKEKRRANILRTSDTDRKIASIADDNLPNKPSDALEVKELLSRFDVLRSELKVPLEMCMAGYKYHEIAKELDIPLGTVKNRIHHARLILRGLMNS